MDAFRRTSGEGMEGKGSYEGDSGKLLATELRLGLPGTVDDEPLKPMASTNRGGKRTLSEVDEESGSWGDGTDAGGAESGQDIAPATKTQVVGWPPIRSYRKNCLPGRNTENEAPGLYVKVRMDGAPYLRKIDLKAYKGYKDFREAMEGMFRCVLGGFYGAEGKTSLERDVIIYEDKDGDWMLAGDVPWEMFTSSCKRLRIMKWSEARGLRL